MAHFASAKNCKHIFSDKPNYSEYIIQPVSLAAEQVQDVNKPVTRLMVDEAHARNMKLINATVHRCYQSDHIVYYVGKLYRDEVPDG